jgi:hypothetical protein
MLDKLMSMLLLRLKRASAVRLVVRRKMVVELLVVKVIMKKFLTSSITSASVNNMLSKSRLVSLKSSSRACVSRISSSPPVAPMRSS